MFVDWLLELYWYLYIVGDVNIYEVCECVCVVMFVEFLCGFMIECDYDVSVLDLCGDKEQLIQVLFNIVCNVVQVLCEWIVQGDVKIELCMCIVCKVMIVKCLYWLVLDLYVIDNGFGILEEICDWIFYLFVFGCEDGSGFGFMFVQMFVQQYDGMIEVESWFGCIEFQILLLFDY